MPSEHEHDRTHSGPTDEVGSEGGSPGDIDVDRDAEILAGTELEQNVVPERESVKERDRNLTRDDRPDPRH
jgi:hypothetical protein